MDGASDPTPPGPEANEDTGVVNGQDNEQGGGTLRQSAQDMTERQWTDTEGEEQEDPTKPEEEEEDEEEESKKSNAQLPNNVKSQSRKEEENPTQPGNEDYKKAERTEGKGTKEGEDPTKGGNDNTKEQGHKDNVALNEKEENKTGKEEGSKQADEDNGNVEVTTDRADLTKENKTEQGDENDVTMKEKEDDETEETADINRAQQQAGGQGIPSTVTDLNFNNFSGSGTLQSSTGGDDELDSSGEITSFSSLPADQTSTPIHPSGTGLLGGNNDTVSSEPSGQTSVPERSLESRGFRFAHKTPRNLFHPSATENKHTSFSQPSAKGRGNANAGFAGSSATFAWPAVKSSSFSFFTHKDLSPENSAQPFTHPKGKGPAGDEQIAPSQTFDEEKAANASAESPQDSGIETSLSNSDHFANPEQDHSLQRDQTSTPIHPSGTGLLGGNNDTVSSEPSGQTSVPERSLESRGFRFAHKTPRNLFHPSATENKHTSFSQPSAKGRGNANAGFAGSSATFAWPSSFSFFTHKDQSPENSAQPFTHPKGKGPAGDEQIAPSQTFDEEKAANASAESPQDSGIETSLSNSDHFANPEQDHSLQREDIQKLETQNHQLRNQLEQQNDEISRLTADTNSLSFDRDRLNGENQKQMAELLAFYREKEHLTKQMTELVDEKDGLNAECNGLRANVAELKSRNENLQQQRAELREEIVQLQANLYRLTNERDELQITSQKQVSQLTGDRDALRAGCGRLNGLVEELTNAKASLEDAKHDLEVFCSTAWTGAAGGTTIKFNPPSGQDTLSKYGVTTNVNTQHQCITAMKDYENKSMEELRMEDYTANRKGKQAGTATSFFSQSAPQATQAGNTGFSFGQPAAASTGGFCE